MNPKPVIIIGAGLAGLSTATHLLQRGVRPVLLETKPFVGGRTASWEEEGLKVETGLHRFLGFYKHLPQLLHLANIKLSDVVQWEDEIEIRLPDGPHATFGLSPLHKPLKTIWRMLNNRFLHPKDKASLIRFFLTGMKDYVSRPGYLDTITVLEYAQRQQVTKLAIERALTPATEGIFFLPASTYSAYALFGLVTPYWRRLHRLRVGAFKGGMTEVMCGPLAKYIQSQGGTVILGHQVLAIRQRADNTFEIRTARRRFNCQSVVLATSLRPAQQILYASFGNEHFGQMLQLETMPAVTFQIELKKPCLPIDRTTFGPLTSMAAFAEQSRTTFPASKGRLSIILSPPQAYIHLPADAILQTVLRDAKRLGLRLADDVLAYRKVIIPHDFYLLSPGAEALRPPAETAIPGLYLAGDYTKQQYLATMEGAAYSGLRAAQLVKNYLAESTV